MKRLFVLSVSVPLVVIFIISIFLASCNMKHQDSAKEEKKANTADSNLTYTDIGTGRIFKPTKAGSASTDYTFDLKMSLPKGFYFDTITINDSERRADYELYCLQCSNPEMVRFNKAIRKELLANVKKDMLYVDPYTGNESVDPIYSYELGPFELFINEKLLSLCCIIDTYSWGGNHHNYSWYTFNYNLKTNKIIRFKDVFKLKSSKDFTDFVELTKRQQKEGNSFLDWKTTNDSVDFSFVKKGICINPELSWACGMQRAFITPDSLRKFMNKEW